MNPLSFSTWKRWHECPAATWADKVAHQWRPCSIKPMVVGKIVEAALACAVDSPVTILATLDAADRELMIANKGKSNEGWCADALKAVEWGCLAKRHPAVAECLRGARLQVRIEFALAGVPFVGYADILEPSDVLWDVKALQDRTSPTTGKVWCDRQRGYTTPIADARYGYQLALYREGLRQMGTELREAGLILLGKHTTADGRAIPHIRMPVWGDPAQLDGYVEEVTDSLQHPWTCDTGATVAPLVDLYESDGADLPRCGECDWCIEHDDNPITNYADPQPRARY